MSEQDCMRCEETYESEVISEYCPKCQKNMNRLDMQIKKDNVACMYVHPHSGPCEWHN